MFRPQRIKAKLTARAACEKLQISPVYLSYIENHKREPSLAVIKRMAALYGCTVAELLADEYD